MPQLIKKFENNFTSLKKNQHSRGQYGNKQIRKYSHQKLIETAHKELFHSFHKLSRPLLHCKHQEHPKVNKQQASNFWEKKIIKDIRTSLFSKPDKQHANESLDYLDMGHQMRTRSLKTQ